MSSSAGALTRVHSLADVERPEDLPPEIAEELAKLAADEPRSVARWLRHLAPRAGVAALASAALAFVAPLAAAIPVIAVLATAEGPWRRQVLMMVDERMKELGLSRWARSRITARIVELTGNPPRSDPAERPSAERILEHLAPQRSRLGDAVAPPRMTALERQRDDLRLAALGWLRQSRLAIGGGYVVGAATVAGGLQLARMAWRMDQLIIAGIFVASGLGIGFGARWFRHGAMRRAIPHVKMSFKKSRALSRRIARAAKDVDKSMPDTRRAELIAALVLDEGGDQGSGVR